MKATHVRSRFVSFAIGSLALLQISPVMAGGQSDAQLVLMQGTRVPGPPTPPAEQAENKHRGGVDITYTKWITTLPLMEGFTGGDVPGVFAGEVFQRQVSRDGRVIRLEAVYEVKAGDRSFTALIRGGTGETKPGEPASVSGAALLDGVILAGWRTGARVHVEFQTKTNCAGAPDARTCFEGTIHIGRASED
jgi:hypothetical protein